MKKLILIFLISCLSTFAQNSTSFLKDELGVNFISTSLKNNQRAFIILNVHYEKRTPLLRDKLGLGLNFTNVKSKFKNENEIAMGVIFNYHLFKNDKFDPYFGVNPVYSKKDIGGLEQLDNFHLKYQAGLKYLFTKNIGMSIELSNYRFNGGLIPSDGKKLQGGGVHPTIGILAKF